MHFKQTIFEVDFHQSRNLLPKKETAQWTVFNMKSVSDLTFDF
jgi:hypothetical protein